jgi:AhpD family alkylhydroperoxidase
MDGQLPLTTETRPMMFEEIGRIRDLRKRYNGKMFKSGIDTFRAFEELEAKALASGSIERKYKELAGLAISIVSGCYGCIEYHTTAALENGATPAQVAEMSALAVCMGGGMAEWAARYAFSVMEQLEKKEGPRPD